MGVCLWVRACALTPSNHEKRAQPTFGNVAADRIAGLVSTITAALLSLGLSEPTSGMFPDVA